MGLCIYQRKSSFSISNDKVEEAASALEQLRVANKEHRKDVLTFSPQEKLNKNFYYWRSIFKADGSVIDLKFIAEKKYCGEEEDLKAIAPFVKDGSWIEMQDEDDVKFRWIFDNGVLRERKVR